MKDIVRQMAPGLDLLKRFDEGEETGPGQAPSWANRFTPATADELIALHDEIVSPGLRDRALLESAAGSQAAMISFSDAGFFEVAAALAARVAKNHPFLDGNKRTALLSIGLLFRKNGLGCPADTEGLARAIIGIAEGRCDHQELARLLAADTCLFRN